MNFYVEFVYSLTMTKKQCIIAYVRKTKEIFMVNFEREKLEATVKSAYDKIRNLRKRTKELICIGMTVMMLGSFVAYDAATGIAYASGSGEGTPHSIMAGNQEIAVVQSRSDAEMVVENIKVAYGKDSGSTAMITPAISIAEKEYVTAESVDVKTTKEATDAILEMNDSKNPVFKVVVTHSVVRTQSIKPKTKIVKTDNLEKGKKKVAKKGKAGKKIVLGKQTLVNGKVESSNIYSEEVTVKPQTRVIYKGTKVKEEATASSSNSRRGTSSSVSSNRGSSSSAVRFNPSKSYGVVGYAQGFHGVPYVSGGSTPAGFDCSGFTSYVYRAFGVSLPRTSGAQAGCGTYVPASQARPGDLVVMPGHVGIYAGNGMMVHSPRPGKSVCTVPIWQSCSFRRIV